MDYPQQLGRYQIKSVLGRGAMGVVYEGIDPRLNRRVAIKVISTSRLEPELRAEYSSRFIHEAQAVARLNHPNIVTVYDFGEEDGAAYLVMEMIAGENLSAYFDESQGFQLEFTLDDAVRMTAELLDAVGYAHQNAIVHRDIKPANVMLTADLKVKLTDFGVARMGGPNPGLTQTGALVGTPSFMSPEQISGDPVGPCSDIFSVGIILYQFLTTERPFRGNGMFAVQQRIMYDQPVPPTLINPSLSPMFDHIVMRALAKKPADRYPDARTFKQDLWRALNGETISTYGTLPPAHAGTPGASGQDVDATRSFAGASKKDNG